MGRLLHDRAGQGDGVLRARNAGHSSGLESSAIHDGGVKFVPAICCEDGALACIEQRIILQVADGGLDSVERRAAIVENR